MLRSPRKGSKKGLCIVHDDWCALGGGSDYVSTDCRRRGEYLTPGERRDLEERERQREHPTDQERELAQMIAEARERHAVEQELQRVADPEGWERDRLAEKERQERYSTQLEERRRALARLYPKPVTEAQKAAFEELVAYGSPAESVFLGASHFAAFKAFQVAHADALARLPKRPLAELLEESRARVYASVTEHLRDPGTASTPQTKAAQAGQPVPTPAPRPTPEAADPVAAAWSAASADAGQRRRRRSRPRITVMPYLGLGEDD